MALKDRKKARPLVCEYVIEAGEEILESDPWQSNLYYENEEELERPQPKD